jgi:hypothetical protein
MLLKALPYISFIAGIGAALIYHWTEGTDIGWYASTSVAFFFGIAAIFWGLNELNAGEALIYRAPYTASRANQPIVFWIIILIFRFLIGAVLIAGFVWRLAGH